MPSHIIFPYSVSDATMTKAGLSPLYIEPLEGQRIKGVKDSYFKPIDVDLLESNDRMRGFISAIDDLTIDDSHRLQRQVSELRERRSDSKIKTGKGRWNTSYETKV